METRKIKGLQIAQTRKIKKLNGGFAVQSQNGRKFYFVNKKGKCTCPDFEVRNADCKHAFAVQYFLQEVTTTKQGVKIETKRLTYPQAWSAYNKSQETEKERFLELLNDLIEEPIKEEKRSRGQPKISEHDLFFASALKVYSQFSLRRFMSDLKEAKQKGFVERKPCFASVGHFIQKESLTPQIKELIQKSAIVLKNCESQFSIDSTGFRTKHFSPYCQEKHGEDKKHEYLKLHAVVGCKTNIITSCEVTQSTGKGTGDCTLLPKLVEQTSQNFEAKEYSADKAYNSRPNLQFIDNKNAIPFIPFKRNSRQITKGGGKIWSKMFHYFKYNETEFMEHYHVRSNVESTFGALKAKFNDTIKSKTFTAQKNELLLKVLCFNIVQVIHETNELGIKTNF